ncbi:hypothetical protein, variant [Aphanomyces astaci]|uniref:VASt domain-containing protein n=1 Tax=Aphanomyces astaci TaxID=112090 RepID=W4GAU1_APHAT|nr:hypothetical protein, variant [Aphanomyces astaci]ETV76812.1 hypothetical protein, variant [Aphanomyces astaci]|eukprot:XP_009833723.1 hypothetical protein, variant [Aphanomyces astaci]
MQFDVGKTSLGSGLAMGAVLGMFWMRVVIGFSYLEASFYLIFPLSLTVVVLTEERSLGSVVDALLCKVSSLVWMAMHADTPATVASHDDHDSDDHANLLPRPSDPLLDMHFKASNTSDLITSANSSLFNGLQDDLIDHPVDPTGGPVYLQDTATGFFLKYVDGKVKMTSSPDDSCLFEWVQGKTHHWGLLSTACTRFVGQNMLSQIVVSARKMQNWEAFRVLQNASLPPTSGQYGLSSSIYLVLCSARFGKGMWVSSRGRDDDKLVVGLAKQFPVALCLRYATSLDVFQSAALPCSPLSEAPRPSMGASPHDQDIPTSFHQAATRTSILHHQLLPSTVTTVAAFADAYDALLPAHTDHPWQVHALHGNVRSISYPTALSDAPPTLPPRSPANNVLVVHEFHHYECNVEATEVTFETKLTLGDTLVPSFSVELIYTLKQQQQSPPLSLPPSTISSSGRLSSSTAMMLDCHVGVHWAKPCMFEGYVHLSAVRAATAHARHLVAQLTNGPRTSSSWTSSFGALLVQELHQCFAAPSHVLVGLGGAFFEGPLTPVYSTTWPITPADFHARMLTDAAWFFRQRDPATVPAALDMSPWAPCAGGHIRVQRFMVAVAGRQELVEEYQTYATPEPNTLQIGRKITLPRTKPWTVTVIGIWGGLTMMLWWLLVAVF